MTEPLLPTTHYARSGEVSIAYQVMGEGPVDLILVPGIVSHVEFQHEFSGYTELPSPSGHLCASRSIRQAWPGTV